MYVVYGYVELYLPYCSSLKEKRKIIHGLISRIRKRFNVSISQSLATKWVGVFGS